MLLPHLAPLKNLVADVQQPRRCLTSTTATGTPHGQMFSPQPGSSRRGSTEPVEISQLVRFADTKLVFDATWQLLQTNGWPDDQLAAVAKSEWASDGFFHQPAGHRRLQARRRGGGVPAGAPAIHFEESDIPSPISSTRCAAQSHRQIFSEFARYWGQRKLPSGMAATRTKKTCSSSTATAKSSFAPPFNPQRGSQMRHLPGVANVPQFQFQSPYQSRLQAMMNNLHRIGMAFQQARVQPCWPTPPRPRRAAESSSPPSRSNAIAERYGAYPGTLAALCAGISKNRARGFHGRPAVALPAHRRRPFHPLFRRLGLRG
jgi:hypothetical protein